MAAGDNPFPQEALEKNRSGSLADSQYTWLRAMSKDSRRTSVSIALGAAVIGMLLLFASSQASTFLTRTLVGVALLLVAAFFFVRGMSGGDSLTRDLRSGYVESIEGAMLKGRRTTGGRSSSTTYWFQVSGKQLRVTRDQYEWAPEAAWVRLFYLPHSGRVVNFERLADHPVPTRSPQEAVKAALGGMRSHDPEAKAEAYANVIAVGEEMKATFEAARVPAGGERDPRPLAEAIIGTWSNDLITVTFKPDGSADVSMPSGHDRSVHWSVDSSGRLVSELGGQHGSAEAYIAGGQLTVVDMGSSLTFRRTA